MPRRRPFAHVFRRRLAGSRSGAAGTAYRPGWYVRLRQGGRELLRYGGPDRETAIAFANRLARESDRRDLLDEAPTPDVDFEHFGEEYLRYAQRTMTPKSYASRERLVRGVLAPFFLRMRLADLRTSDVHRFLASRADASGATRNRALTALSAIFRRGQELGIIQENPATRVRRAKETRFPLTLVDDAQQGALLGSLAEPVRTFVLLLLDSGLRLGEALDLGWADVDLERGTLHVRTSKAKRPRVVAIPRRLGDALARHRQRRALPLRGPDFVFSEGRACGFLLAYAWRTAFKKAAALIGVPSLRIHDLRHLYAVNLVRRGLDLPTVQAVLGHTSLLSTLRYAEYADGSAPFRAARALDAMHASASTSPVSGH